MACSAGFGLKLLQWFLRVVECLCAALILAIFSYFLATLNNHSLQIDNYVRAVEGISGAAVLYTLLSLLLLCFVAGHPFSSAIAIILDIAFWGAFIYIAHENRGGARSCSGYVDTVFGSGDTNNGNQVSNSSGSTILPSFKQACQLQSACFAVAIVAIVFFLLSALVEIALARHRRKEKVFGPSPANNYTEGSGPSRRRGRFGRKKRDAALAAGGLAAHGKRHPDSLPAHTTPEDVRNSYNTDNTAVGTESVGHHKYGQQTGIADGYPATNAIAGYANAGYNRNSGYGYTNVGHAHETPATGYYTSPVTHNAEYRDAIARGHGEIPASQYGQYSVHNQAGYY